MSETPTFDGAEAFTADGVQEGKLEEKPKPDKTADIPSPPDIEKNLEAARTQRILETTAMQKRFASLLTPQEMRTLNITVENAQTVGLNGENSMVTQRDIVEPLPRRYNSIGVSFRKDGTGKRVTLEQAVHWNPTRIGGAITVMELRQFRESVSVVAAPIADLNGVPEESVRRGLEQIAHRIEQKDFGEKPKDIAEDVFDEDRDPEDHETSEHLDTLNPELQSHIREQLGDRVRTLHIASEISGAPPIKHAMLRVSYENAQGRQVERVRRFRFLQEGSSVEEAQAIRDQRAVGTYQVGLERVLSRLFLSHIRRSRIPHEVPSLDDLDTAPSRVPTFDNLDVRLGSLPSLDDGEPPKR